LEVSKSRKFTEEAQHQRGQERGSGHWWKMMGFEAGCFLKTRERQWSLVENDGL